MIKGAIWDVDGTLLDSMKLWDHLASDYLKSIGKNPEENLEDILFTMSMQKGAEYMKSAYELDLSIQEIIDGMNDTMARFYRDQAELKEGAYELLRDMKNAGIEMIIATSTDRQHIEAALSRLKILEYFKKILTCSEVGVGKVKPDIYLLAAKELGTKPAETLVLEDAYHAAKTAKDAGFVVAGIYDASSASHQSDVKDVSDIYMEKYNGLEDIIKSL